MSCEEYIPDPSPVQEFTRLGNASKALDAYMDSTDAWMGSEMGILHDPILEKFYVSRRFPIEPDTIYCLCEDGYFREKPPRELMNG